MQLKEIDDQKIFVYCRARSLKDFHQGRCRIAVGDMIYAMFYPGNHWHLFNTTDETETKQYRLTDSAKLGIDFERFTETATPKKES